MERTLPLEHALDALLARLSDVDEHVRAAAGDALVALASRMPESLQRLLAALTDASPIVRGASAGALGRGGCSSAIDALSAATRDDDSGVRLAAVHALGALSAGADALVERLENDPDPDVRAASATSLVTVAFEEREAALVRALGDEDVRETALAALAAIGWVPDSEIGAAVLCLAKRDLDGLVAVGDAAVPLLARALRDPSPDKSSVLLRTQFVATLGRIGTPAALEGLAPSVGDPGGPARAEAARQLGRHAGLAPRSVVPALVSMVAGDSFRHARIGASTALGQMRETSAASVLRTAAESDDEPTVRLAAAQALAGIGETGLLIEQLQSPVPDVRAEAATKLGELDEKRAIDPLIGALGDSYATVRGAALTSLRQIGWTPVGVKRRPEDPRYSRWMTRAEQLGRAGVSDAEQAALLTEDLAAEDPRVRQAALEALQKRADPASYPAIVLRLDDEHRLVRRTAAEVLTSLGAIPLEGGPAAAYRVAMGDLQGAAALPEVAKPALLRALREHEANDRAEAARTLVMLGGDDVAVALRETLEDPESYVRTHAILALGAVAGADAVEPLALRLADEHSVVRTASGRTLAALGEPGAEALIAGLEHPSELAREAAASALVLAGGHAAPAGARLEELLANDRHVGVRVASAQALGGIPGRHDPLLAAVVHDDSWRVRCTAAASIGRTNPDGAADVLVRSLADSYRAVREASLAALDSVGWKPQGDVGEAMLRLAKEDWKGLVSVGPAAIDLLARALQEKGPDSIAVERRVKTVETLEAIGERTPDPRFGSALRPALTDIAGPVRAAAARAAGRLSLTELGQALLSLGQNDPIDKVRMRAVSALGRCGDTSMGLALQSIAASDPAPGVQFAAAEALAGPAIGDAALLISSLRASEEEVRLRSADKLGELGATEAIDALIASLGDAVVAVRAAARRALEALGWVPVGVKGDAEEVGYRRWLTKSEVVERSGSSDANQGPLLSVALADPDPAVRRAAAEALADRGEATAAEALIPLLEDEDPTVRHEAAVALERLSAIPEAGAAAASARVALGDMAGAAAIGAPSATSLLRAASEVLPERRAAAVVAMGPLPADLVGEGLLSALEDPAAVVRVAATGSLATALGDGAVEPLFERLCDPAGEVRAAAGGALLTLGKAGADALVRALRHDRPEARLAALAALPALTAVASPGSGASAGPPPGKVVGGVTMCATGDESAAVRAAAVPILASLAGADAGGELSQLLRNDTDMGVRRAAAAALGTIASEGAAAALVAALGDAFGEVRDAAQRALDDIGWVPSDGVSAAVVALVREDWGALVEVGEAAAPLIARVLLERDMDPGSQLKRAEAIACLSRIGGDVAVKAVGTALRDPSGRVRGAAADAAGRLRVTAVAEDLTDMVEGDPDYRARARAATGLGILGIAEAAPALSRAAVQDDDPLVRSAAAIALAGPGIGDLERLIHQLTDRDAELRRLAAVELGRLKNPKGLDPLVSALADAYASVRVAAKASLFDLGWIPFGLRRTADAKGLERWVLRQELSPASDTTPQLEVMAGAADHPDPLIRAAVAEGLGLLGDPRALSVLKRMSKDADPKVAGAAQRAVRG